jgi:N-acyl-D-aspartate/D-glutamate deacylase
MGLNDAIRSMTYLPAEKLGMTGRGKLEPGAFADIVVMDLNTLKDRSTYENPTLYAEGVVDLLVNGVLTI